MLKANQAVRLGLRAATRNPELAFGKGLLDQAGTLLSFLPGALIVAAIVGLSHAEPLEFLVRTAEGLRRAALPLAGAFAAIVLVGWTLGAAFWAGALPLLAADAELGRRPPEGHFFQLAGGGFARVVLASLVTGALGLLVHVAVVAALVTGLLAFAGHPSIRLAAGFALVMASGIGSSFLVDLLGRLTLVRAAVFADGPATALAKAASLIGARLGAFLGLWAAFVLLELIVASASAALSGIFSGGFALQPGTEALALAPRLALGLATGVVLSWIEVARHGALAALAADAEGLIDPHSVEPAPRPERVIEALPAEEPVIEALPYPEPPKE